jgi:hypothetical protein
MCQFLGSEASYCAYRNTLFLFLWYWGLNSGPCAKKELALEAHSQTPELALEALSQTPVPFFGNIGV